MGTVELVDGAATSGLYSAAVFALKDGDTEGQMLSHLSSYAVIAGSAEDAHAAIEALATECYPAAQGFRDHLVAVEAIPDGMVLRAGVRLAAQQSRGR